LCPAKGDDRDGSVDELEMNDERSVTLSSVCRGADLLRLQQAAQQKGRSKPAPLQEPGGFTLIELLVVCGLIAALVGISALALRGRGGEGAALANAQSVVAGLASAARTQAVVNQTNTRLLVYATLPPSGDASKYLRSLQVVREDPVGSNAWVAAGYSAVLPAPICIVPPSPVPATHLNTGVIWPTNPAPVSTLSTIASFNYFGQIGTNGRGVGPQFFGLSGNGRVYYIEFGSDGSITSPANVTPEKIAVTTAILQPAAVPKFNNKDAVRGIVLRKTGAIAMVNESTGF
jgi:type II secretory pathway pseudopilin PulG